MSVKAVEHKGVDRSADDGSEHVFLGIPDVALSSQKRDTKLRVKEHRRRPFENLIQIGNSDNHRKRDKYRKSRTGDKAGKDLKERTKEQQPEEKMDNPVV